MDWDELGDEAVEYLQDYISIDTSNPPGNEAPAVEFLKGILEGEGISCKTYEPQPGRMSLLARLPADGSRKPLIFLNHVDVVPADPDGWELPPFSGALQDGYIWGRGALDMKGLGIMQLTALLAAKRNGLKLAGDVVFLAVADEEAGGLLGARYIIDNDPEAVAGGACINEGGFINTGLVEGKDFFTIGNAEKSAVWLRLTRRGVSGHGSIPSGQGALESMVKALARLLGQPRPMEIVSIMQDFAYRLSEYMEFLRPYREDHRLDTLKKLLEENNIMAIPQLAALLHDTFSLNMLDSGTKINVIPDKAEAQLDCRLLPGTGVDEFLRYVREKLDDPGMEIELCKEVEISDASPADNEYYRAIEEAVNQLYPEAVVVPFMMPGVSDSRYFRQIGVDCYGVMPARMGLGDTSRIHGVNERISVADLKQGARLMYELIVRLCS
jgi:acetylornithine deacetylase/succinyl-diaminopimelate desuccinylase-like protein